MPGAPSSCPFDPGDYEPRLGLFRSLLHYFVGWFTFRSLVDAVFGWFFLLCVDACNYKWLGACVEIWLLLYAELKSLTYMRIRRRRRRKPPDPRRRLTGNMKRVMKTARFFYEDCADYIRAWTLQLVSRLHLALRRSVELAWICRLCIVVRVLNSTPVGLGIRCGKG